MAISMTPRAASHVRRMLEKRGGGLGLKLGVKKTGCSGFAYALDYADKAGEDEVVFDSQALKIVVPKQALALIDGTEVDYVSEGLNQMFRFRNPNMKDECGCGESFTV
ncbi:MAG: iron-sulfur cluster assembly accessory protein [Proteobacteria bacterium]|nr:iron-sulfur cluster assembly accessory protein [Pseudomonadota bacterium]